MILDGFLWGLGFLLAMIFAAVLSIVGTLAWAWAYDSWVQRRVEKHRCR